MIRNGTFCIFYAVHFMFLHIGCGVVGRSAIDDVKRVFAGADDYVVEDADNTRFEREDKISDVDADIVEYGIFIGFLQIAGVFGVVVWLLRMAYPDHLKI
ncbi:hypothetical protein DPMN_113497 [Dreissena polymorpha]|uniref:Uncharacterized protein n=1 Tax=Dreissena polymorpha TaxID=45954 RepID=A0A9D4KIB3_DREPO|nr:hypothetical protein DPMN_113497 [Dreissena polymorpha]